MPRNPAIERRVNSSDPGYERRMQLDKRANVDGLLFAGWQIVTHEPMRLIKGNQLATVENHWISYETLEHEHIHYDTLPEVETHAETLSI